MRLYEFESKKILSSHGIPVPRGRVAATPQEAGVFAQEVKGPVVLKAQVLATGRGKVGGVRFVQSPREVKKIASAMLQTQIGGYPVESLLIEEKIDIKQELYLGATYDEVKKTPLIISSSLGGVDLNEVSRQHPEKIHKSFFSSFMGLQPYKAWHLVQNLKLPGKLPWTAQAILLKLWQIFSQFDAVLVEINPLVLTRGDELVALDAHIEIEDDALFRQKERLKKFQIEEREDKARPPTQFEIEAARIDRADYRGVAGRVTEFDGDLGLLIGAGGGSLTTFDAILRHGGKPANYCEVGGNAPVSKIYKLAKLILSKPGVKGIAVITNVYSNSRVDFVARGLIKAMVELGIDPKSYPVLFRSAGAFEQEGYAILKKYGVRYYDRSTSMDEAARLAVQMIKKESQIGHTG